MYQDYMKPISLTSIALDGSVNKNVGSKGDAIPGYEDATFVSFSGVLDKSAKTEKDWQFSINDVTASVLYTRDAGNRTVSKNKYIGIGNISTATWNANEYVYLGFTNFKGERVMWAKKNLGATAESGEGSYGLYYEWGDTNGYAISGIYGNYTCEHTFPTTATTIDLDHFENVGEHSQKKLKPEYDPAHVALKGLWRMPTAYQHPTSGEQIGELGLLGRVTTITQTGTKGTLEAGNTYTGPNGASIFIPFSGYVGAGSNKHYQENGGYYLGNYPSSVCLLSYKSGVGTYSTNTYWRFWNEAKVSVDTFGGSITTQTSGSGMAIRPVFSIK